MESNITVYIQTEDGKHRTVKINAGATLKELKDKVQLIHLITIKSFTVRGRMLGASQEGMTLSELRIRDKSVIQTLARLEGGIRS